MKRLENKVGVICRNGNIGAGITKAFARYERRINMDIR